MSTPRHTLSLADSNSKCDQTETDTTLTSWSNIPTENKQDKLNTQHISRLSDSRQRTAWRHKHSLHNNQTDLSPTTIQQWQDRRCNERNGIWRPPQSLLLRAWVVAQITNIVNDEAWWRYLWHNAPVSPEGWPTPETGVSAATSTAWHTCPDHLTGWLLPSPWCSRSWLDLLHTHAGELISSCVYVRVAQTGVLGACKCKCSSLLHKFVYLVL